MKIAVCFYGLHPNKCFKGFEKKPDICDLFWKKNVFNDNVDIFLHSFDTDNKELLLKEYNPTAFLFENQQEFPSNVKIPNHYKHHNDVMLKSYNMDLGQIIYCMTYGCKKSVELMEEYEKQHNFTYDLVLLTRIDLLWLKKLDFSLLDKNKFYVPKWGKNNWITKHKNYNEVLGTWYLSNSNNIKKFSKFYDLLPFYYKNGWVYEHKLFKLHVDSITKNIEYKFRTADEAEKLEEIYCDKLRGIVNKFEINYIKNLL